MKSRKFTILLYLGALTSLTIALISACDGASPTAAEAQLPSTIDLSNRETLTIRPIADVTLDQPPAVTDITAADAILRFDSTIPLACAIVYGQTTDYGMIATDMDMAGGAHTDHHPLLTGLEPDTEYHYRVQGSAADGSIFVGEDATFATPAATPSAEVNLASLAAGARVIAVSSNFGGATDDEAWGADSAIDGSAATAWSSNGDGNDAFIEIQFAAESIINAVEVWTRTMSNNTAQIFTFTLTTASGNQLGPFDLTDASQGYRFEIDGVVTRSLRLDVIDSNGGNTGLVEFAAYGSAL